MKGKIYKSGYAVIAVIVLFFIVTSTVSFVRIVFRKILLLLMSGERLPVYLIPGRMT